MALTIDQLRALLDGEKLNYFLDPKQPAVMFTCRGAHGRYNFYFALESDGQFLQMRTMGLLECPNEHPHLGEVLRVLAEINGRTRFIKFARDSRAGEITAFGDTWVMDGTVTPTQFQRMLANYFPAVDENYARIQTAIETGKDPGEVQRPVPGASPPPAEPPKPEVDQV